MLGSTNARVWVGSDISEERGIKREGLQETKYYRFYAESFLAVPGARVYNL